MDELIIVSVDSHAQAPPEAWAQYLEPAYHELLPGLHEENEVFTTVMGAMSGLISHDPAMRAVFDTDGRVASDGHLGIWDAERRLAEMDREGIAGEFVYPGDHRATAIFFNTFNRARPPEVCDAGVRAYNRWVHDALGGAPDRLLLVGGATTGLDLDATLDELDWLADHGFRGTYAPGYSAYPDIPPFSDEHWDPVWARCVERGLPLFVHAGFGLPQGSMFHLVDTVKRQLDAPGADPREVIIRATTEVFTGEFFSDVSPRRPMWQLMLGGVFDRHPDLKLVMTEVRADWLPATLRYLDELYLAHRDDLPARHSPTEYWHANCLTSLSFVHKAEVEMRYEMGIETIAFGRDYPHNESTWPNTQTWLGDAFAAVPDNELRLALGENVIRFLDLDRPTLARIAREIGPTRAELEAKAANATPELLGHFDMRGGYRKPPEGDRKLDEIRPMIVEDLATVGVDA
jgi:predicted TIM-barrel fold metal-dependent hydrolase